MASPSKGELSQMLVGMGFDDTYIGRAFRVYEKNYGKNYNMEIITEIIFRLKQKDESKGVRKSGKKKDKGSQKDGGGSSKHKSQHSGNPSPSNHHQSSSSSKHQVAKPAPSFETQAPAPAYASFGMGGPSGGASGAGGGGDPAGSQQSFESEAPPPAFTYGGAPSSSGHHPPPAQPSPASLHRKSPQPAPARPRPSPSPNPRQSTKQKKSIQPTPSSSAASSKSKSSHMDLFRKGEEVYFKDRKAGGGKGKIVVAVVLEASSSQVKITYPKDAPKTTVLVNPAQIQRVKKPSKNDYDVMMTLAEAEKLRIHDELDHRDEVGRFVFATVVEKHGANLKIHYVGWSRKWDCYSDFRKELHRFARPAAVSKRPAHRFKHLKKGDFVDVRPVMRHDEWLTGEIRRKDKHSGQVQVVYDKADKNYLYWAHLDDENEIAEFTTRSGTVQETQARVESEIRSGGGMQAPQMSEEERQARLKRKREKKRRKKERAAARAAAKAGKAPPSGHFKTMGIQTEKQQMEMFQRLRQKRFPLEDGEKVKNPWTIGDWLEVQDMASQRWMTATVIDQENNWVVVHYDGFSNKYDQRIHVIKMGPRLRKLGADLAESERERLAKEEMESFKAQLKQMKWKLVEIGADGNCLYRSFAYEIYGTEDEHPKVRAECIAYMKQNKDFFQNFILDFDDKIKIKARDSEWGDHVDITALSEVYNVRVRVFELDSEKKKLYMSFDQGQSEATIDLPLILLARHGKKHYNIIQDPQSYIEMARPLGTCVQRNESVNIRKLRLDEEKKYQRKEEDDDGKEEDLSSDDDSSEDDLMDVDHGMSAMDIGGGRNGTGRGSIANRSGNDIFGVTITDREFADILASASMMAPLDKQGVAMIFPRCMASLRMKLQRVWDSQHSQLDSSMFAHFYSARFGPDRLSSQIDQFLRNLQDKVHSDRFGADVFVSTFNQTVASHLCSALTSVVQSLRHRQSITQESVRL